MRNAARICPNCRYQFPESLTSPVPRGKGGGKLLLIAALLITGLGAGLMYWLGAPEDDQPVLPVVDRVAAPAVTTARAEPDLPLLELGTTLEWIADESPNVIERRAGPYILRITKSSEEGLVAPAIEISSASQKIKLEGSHSGPGYGHRLSLIQNIRGAAPILMLQSFTGGAHCCNVAQLAGFSAGKLRVIELGSWDGDELEAPRDLDGDGVADFLVSDDAFLYAFASYASSYSPPKILNVRGGKVLDVSRKRAFQKLFLRSMNETGERCRTGASGDERNGACPAYVASAALIGRLERAWADMIASYDAATGWDLPTGCLVAAENDCPSGYEITAKSYPEALLLFLKQHGYVARTWQPPESFGQAAEDPEDSGIDSNTI